jgi:uncharacterized Zn finger protein (UPF0148 family)
MYPEKFDRTKLSAADHVVLADFGVRRKSFDNFIKDNSLKLYTCPGCGYPTLEERGGYDICAVCNWEDDNQDDAHADEIWGGPNANLSLTENRLAIAKKLDQRATTMEGMLIDDPGAVIMILKNHEKRMHTIQEKIKPDTSSTDLVWEEWRQESDKIITDLIKGK